MWDFALVLLKMGGGEKISSGEFVMYMIAGALYVAIGTLAARGGRDR